MSFFISSLPFTSYKKKSINLHAEFLPVFYGALQGHFWNTTLDATDILKVGFQG
jgi:hypothetical protein